MIPEKDSKKHLQYLSNTAKLLTHQDFIEKLKKAQTPEEIKNLFKKSLVITAAFGISMTVLSEALAYPFIKI